MENKQIELECPCCSATLTIDVLTRTVMRAVPPHELEAGDAAQRSAVRWDQATERVEGRGAKAKDKLESALSMEKSKESRLDDLFDQANEKLKRREEEGDEPED